MVVLALASGAAARAEAAAPRTIAEFGHGAGKVSEPNSVAIDQESGDLYVADRNNFRIDKFNTLGEFLLAWGWGVADGKSQELEVCGPAAEPPTKRCFGAASATGPGATDTPIAVAVDQSSHDVYVADRGNRRVSKFSPTGHFLYMVGRNVNETKAKEEGPGAPYTQLEKNICTTADLAAGDICGAGEAGSGPNEFTRPRSLAIDPSGRVWVGDAERLQAIEPDGTPGAAIALPGAGDTRGLAIDPTTGDFYLKSESLPGIRRLHPDGTPYGPPYPLDEAGNPRAVTVGGDGDVYVGECGATTFECPAYRFMVFDPAGKQISQFGAGQVIGGPGSVPPDLRGSNALAVDDGTGTLYTASSRPDEDNSVVQAFPIPEPGPLPDDQHVEDLEPTSATLAATLNPEGHETTYHFEYDTSPYAGEAEHGSKAPIPDATLPASFNDTPVKAELEGLIPDTTYHFRLVATNSEGTVYGEDTTFTTRTAVGIEAQWATAIAARSATLHAELDPRGVAANWWVEYGTSEAYGSQSAEFALPASFGAIPVAVALSGLQPATTYHYRFVAEDEREGETYLVHGEDRTFTTQLAGLGFTLPDDRAWEMVSPPEKHGGRIAAPDGAQGGQVQAAANGEALAYLSYGSLEADPEGNRLIEQSSELARRGTGGAWGTVDITPPHTAAVLFNAGSGLEYKLFSTNLDSALLEPRDCTPLSAQATERTPYLRANSEPPAYEPLVTAANVGPGTPPFGGDCSNPNSAVGVRGATPDLSHVVLGSPVPLLGGATDKSLYEWSAGALQPLSVPPGKEDPINAELGSGEASTRGAISDDGSRVFWTGGGLYVRDTGRGETARLDEESGGFGTGAVKPLFQGASADGAVAFFTDTQNLTEDSGEDGADLYRCEVVVEEETLKCDLTDLSTPTENPSDPFESAEVQGLLPGISADGSRAYFIARGVLDSDPNGEGEGAIPGQPNLYAWHEGEGTRFVATLSGEDGKDWGLTTGPKGDPNPLAAFVLTAQASPSGRYLAFMSGLPLTGYDNRDATSGEPAQEVFRYDAQTDELTCVSCSPSGARPRALIPGPKAGQLTEEFDPNQLWSGETVAALLPEATKIRLGYISLYRPRAVHDDGRVFFNAADSLVAADSNGDGDVYEYEPTGTGSCTAASGDTGTAVVPGACVSLISSGTAEGTAAFLDASEGARDVFFYTPAQLAVTDVDGELDVYDAREEGEPARVEPNAECLGEACQPPAVPPAAQTPASAAFSGPGNPTEARPCPKGRHRVRRNGKTRCVKPRHAKKHNRHHRKHSHGRTGR